MTLLGFTGQTVSPPGLEEKVLVEPQLHFDEALACGRRLWIRGRLVDPALRQIVVQRSKWNRWRRKRPLAEQPRTIELETRVGGQSVCSTASVDSNNRFESAVEIDLPTARRGWRLARNRVLYQGRTLEKCCVVLAPPDDARAALAVLLPLDVTFSANGPERLARSESATALTPILQQLRRTGNKDSLYYLACVPVGCKVGQSELALAATTLGWPSGNFVLLQTESGQVEQALTQGLERLRWLLHGNLKLNLLNMEPAFANRIGNMHDANGDGATPERIVNYGQDARTLLSAEAVGGTALPMPVRLMRAGLVPRLPVVFCHGMLAFSTLKMELPENSNCFWALREFLHPRGFRVFFPQVAPTGSVAFRAGQLRDQILRWTDEPINLIAHSMGGLDARYLISQLGMADRVRSLTTVSTPHRGTALVDWFLANYRQRVPLLLALEAAGFNVDGFRDCCPAACREFNARTPDMPGVSYFSYGGEVPVSRVTAPLRRAWYMLTALEGPNDGMVSLASARWGEYLGTVHADHFAQTPDLKFIHPHEDFDPLRFYFRILEDLARRGF
jgi:triacylglycerol lipase